MRLRRFEIHSGQVGCFYLVDAVLKLLEQAYPGNALARRGGGMCAHWTGTNVNCLGHLRIRPEHWPKEAYLQCVVDHWAVERVEDMIIVIPSLSLNIFVHCEIANGEVTLYRSRKKNEPQVQGEGWAVKLTPDDLKP